MRAALIQAAKAWGKKPSELGLCSENDDLAYIIAWEQAENRMVAWERQEADGEVRKNATNWS